MWKENKEQNKMIEDKDIGLKIATEEENYWTKVKESTDKDIFNAERSIIINRKIRELAINQLAKVNK